MHASSFCRFVVLLGILLGATSYAAGEEAKKPIRVGIVGLDAHAVPWTKILTDPKTQRRPAT